MVLLPQPPCCFFFSFVILLAASNRDYRSIQDNITQIYLGSTSSHILNGKTNSFKKVEDLRRSSLSGDVTSPCIGRGRAQLLLISVLFIIEVQKHSVMYQNYFPDYEKKMNEGAAGRPHFILQSSWNVVYKGQKGIIVSKMNRTSSALGILAIYCILLQQMQVNITCPLIIKHAEPTIKSHILK